MVDDQPFADLGHPCAQGVRPDEGVQYGHVAFFEVLRNVHRVLGLKANVLPLRERRTQSYRICSARGSKHPLQGRNDEARIFSGNRVSRVVRHDQGAVRRSQNPFVENTESKAKVGLKVPLEIERNRERHREVLRGNHHSHRHGRNPTKVSIGQIPFQQAAQHLILGADRRRCPRRESGRSEEHTSELQSQSNLVCRLLLEKKKTNEAHRMSMSPRWSIKEEYSKRIHTSL